MRRPVYLLILAAMTAGAQEGDQPPPLRVKAPPTFSAFPASGAGTFGVCSTTPATGLKGEAATVIRPSAAYCTKTASGGLASTGIASGDLVPMSANVMRVEYGWDGVLGPRIESRRNNRVLRSSQFDNASWNKIAGVTVTPDVALAPDGTLTADRVQIVATPTSSVMRGSTSAACDYTMVYARSYPGAGNQQFWLSDGSTQAALCTTTEASWSWCRAPGVGSPFIDIGSNTGNTAIGAGPYPAADVLLWGISCSDTAYPGSLSDTTNAATVREPDDVYFALSTAPGLNTGCIGATVSVDTQVNPYSTPVMVASSSAPASSGANAFTLYSPGSNGGTWKCYVGDNGTPTVYATGTAAFVAPFTGAHRGWCAASGNGAPVTGMFDTNAMSASSNVAGSYAAEAYLFVGGSKNTLTYVDGIVTRVVRDTSTTRCAQ